MSENNNNLSIDEIIRRAQEIKAEAERQLKAAEKSLDEKAKAAMEEVTVDEAVVAQRAAEAYEAVAEEEEDIKEFIPQKRSETRAFGAAVKTEPAETDDVRTEPPAPPAEEKAPADGKTRNIALSSDRAEEKTKMVDISSTDEKTRRVAFVSSSSEETVPDTDLKKIPTIVARENLYDNFGGDTAEAFEEETGVQIKLDGFDDKIETVPTIDEALAEKELEKRRSEKVGKFRLFGPDETDADLGNHSVVEDDYVNKSEKDSFLDTLYARKSALGIKLIITAVLFVPLLLMTVMKDSAYLPNFLTSHKGYFITALILFAGVIAVNFNIFAHGFNIKKGINFDLPIALLGTGIAAHTLLLTFNSSLWIDNGVLLPAAGTFALFMSQLGKHRMMARIIDNFEFITDGNDKYTVENITNAVDAEILSRGMLETEEPRLKMSVKTDFPTNFLEISCKKEPADKLTARVFGAMLVLSAALLVAVGVMDNFNTGFNVALCALTISLPCSALFLTNSVLYDVSSQLSAYGSRVCGFEGAVMANDAGAMVMEAADLFGKDSCDLHGIKTFHHAKVDDAIIHAAAVIIQTKSPLSHVFDDVIIGQQSILPKVEGVQYEERLGTSAWIYKRKVLVGTRELLLHHGVSVPKESFEKKYTIKGRKALYLAVGGEIMAMFIVSYSANPDLKRELSKLEKSGMTIIVKSSDPYINEQSLAELYNLPEGFIRVMNYSAARVFDKYSGLHVEKSPAYVVHEGTALGFVSAMRGAGITVSTAPLIAFLCVFGAVLGFAVVALLALLQSYAQLSALNIIIFQSIWTAFTVVITKLRGLGI